MNVTFLSCPHVSADRDAEPIVGVAVHAGIVTGLTRLASNGSQVRVTPPFAFEVEEFDSRLPDDDWRHRHGLPQTLDLPLPSGW
jgi:hypothetical protein